MIIMLASCKQFCINIALARSARSNWLRKRVPTAAIHVSDGSNLVADVLQELLPALCPTSDHLSGTPRGRSAGPPSKPTAEQDDQPEGQESSSAVNAAGATAEQGSNGVVERKGNELLFHGSPVEALIAGIHVSLDAPVLWLHATLHHPDFFLYVVVHLQRD